MFIQNKYSKPVLFSEELKNQNQIFAKKYYKTQNKQSETNKKQDQKKNTNNSERGLSNQIQINYKKNFEKWINSFNSTELIKVFLAESKWFCSIIIQMYQIISKEGSGSSYKFQLRKESDEIHCSGIGISMNKNNKNEVCLDDYFKHDFISNENCIDLNYEDELIKNLKIIDLHDKFDALTFAESFLENNIYQKTFNLFSNNKSFSSVCSVVLDKKNYYFNYPEWFNVNQYHSIYEFIVAYFERNVCIKYLMSQEKSKIPQSLLSFVDERKLNDFFDTRNRAIKFIKDDYSNSNETLFIDLDLNKILNVVKSKLNNYNNYLCRSNNDIERQINVEDNAYMIYEIKRLFSQLSEKEFIDEMIFNNIDKPPIKYVYCRKIFDSIIDLLSKKNAKDLINDNLTNDSKKKIKNKKKNETNNQIPKLENEKELLVDNNKLKDDPIINIVKDEKRINFEENEDLFKNLTVYERSKINLLQDLSVIKNKSNTIDSKDSFKFIKNEIISNEKSMNPDDKLFKDEMKPLIIENKNFQEIARNSSSNMLNNLKFLCENFDQEDPSIAHFLKIHDENINFSDLNDTDSQYTSTHFSDNRSISRIFNKHYFRSPSFDKIIHKDNSNVKKRKSVPPLINSSNAEEDIKENKIEDNLDNLEIKEKSNELLILENKITNDNKSVEIISEKINLPKEEIDLNVEKQLKKSKKKRNQKFKKQIKNNVTKNDEERNKTVLSEKLSQTNKLIGNLQIENINEKIINTPKETNKISEIKNSIYNNIKPSTNKINSAELKITNESESKIYPEISINSSINNQSQNTIKIQSEFNNSLNKKSYLTKNYNKFSKLSLQTNLVYSTQIQQNNLKFNNQQEFLNIPSINYNQSFVNDENIFNKKFIYNLMLTNSQQVFFNENLNIIQCRLHEEIIQFSIGINQFNEYTKMFKLYSIDFIRKSLKKALKSEITLKIYGSFETDLSIESSDIDLSIKVKDSKIEKIEAIIITSKLLSDTKLFDSVIPISTATVPIIKLLIDPLKILKNESSLFNKFQELSMSEFFLCYRFDKEEISKFKIDLNFFDGQDVSGNLNWVKEQLNYFPEIKPLIHILKRLLHLNKLNSSYDGGLSSYSLLLLIIAFLKNNKYKVINYGKILFDFLNFYGNSFDFTNSYIDICQISPFIYLNGVLDVSPCILDPLTHNNVAKNSFRIKEIKYIFSKALDKLCKHNIIYNHNEVISKNLIFDLLLNNY